MNPGHFCDGVTTTRPPKPFGVEIRGVYDGVVFWACPACEFAWHRFGEDDPLRMRAETHLARWRAA